MTRETMQQIVAHYTHCVNEDEQLRQYRDWVEKNMFGFGERCFLWMWKLLVDRMPDEFTFLEVGVFRGQILGLIGMLAERSGKKVTRYGVTPLDSTDGHWESNYREDIEHLHKTFGITQDYTILQGDSTDPKIIEQAQKLSVDLLYIDGGHAYDVVKSDLDHYPQIVKPKGYLIIDDCNNAHDMPDGYFRGIESVSRAVDEVMPPAVHNPDFAFSYNIVHNRILQRL
jgi:hypothetical protein